MTRPGPRFGPNLTRQGALDWDQNQPLPLLLAAAISVLGVVAFERRDLRLP